MDKLAGAALNVNYPFYGNCPLSDGTSRSIVQPHPDMQLSSSDQHGVPVLRSGDTLGAMFQPIYLLT